jgi:hypothetical protein
MCSIGMDTRERFLNYFSDLNICGIIPTGSKTLQFSGLIRFVSSYKDAGQKKHYHLTIKNFLLY